MRQYDDRERGTNLELVRAGCVASHRSAEGGPSVIVIVEECFASFVEEQHDDAEPEHARADHHAHAERPRYSLNSSCIH